MILGQVKDKYFVQRSLNLLQMERNSTCIPVPPKPDLKSYRSINHDQLINLQPIGSSADRFASCSIDRHFNMVYKKNLEFG